MCVRTTVLGKDKWHRILHFNSSFAQKRNKATKSKLEGSRGVYFTASNPFTKTKKKKKKKPRTKIMLFFNSFDPRKQSICILISVLCPYVYFYPRLYYLYVSLSPLDICTASVCRCVCVCARRERERQSRGYIIFMIWTKSLEE